MLKRILALSCPEPVDRAARPRGAKAINAVPTEQVNAAIRKYLKPDRMVLIKAGSIPRALPPASK